MLPAFLRLLRRPRGFTLIELLTVMAVIAILAGLILSVAGYANKKAAMSRATSEIAALSSACDNFKADNGTYPHQPLASGGAIPTTGTPPSDSLNPRTQGYTGANTRAYQDASLELYQALTGDLTNTGVVAPGSKSYFPNMKPDMMGRSNAGSPVSVSNKVAFLSDPFGNSYGYSTMNSTAVTSGSTGNLPGYNPTFDLWSTRGTITDPTPPSPTDVSLEWIKNW